MIRTNKLLNQAFADNLDGSTNVTEAYLSRARMPIVTEARTAIMRASENMKRMNETLRTWFLSTGAKTKAPMSRLERRWTGK